MNRDRLLSFFVHLYILSSPLYYYRFDGSNIVPTDLIGVLFLLVWIIHVTHRDGGVKLDSFYFVPLLLSLWAVVSSLWAEYVFEAIGSGFLLLYLSVCSIALYDSISTLEFEFRELRSLFYSFIIGSVLMTCIIFSNQFAEVGLRAFAPANSYSQRTQLPYLLVVCAVVAFVLYGKEIYERQWKHRTVYASTYLFSMFIIGISFSRGPWVAVFGVLAITLFFHRDLWRPFLTLNLPVIFTGLIAIIYFGQLSRFADRLTSIIDLDRGETISRTELYADIFSLWADKPLLGFGFNNFSIVMDIKGSTHSTYLMWLAELGIFAFILYLFYPVVFSRDWMRLTKQLEYTSIHTFRLAITAGTLAFLVGQTFSTAIFWFRSFWVLLALVHASHYSAIVNHQDIDVSEGASSAILTDD